MLGITISEEGSLLSKVGRLSLDITIANQNLGSKVMLTVLCTREDCSIEKATIPYAINQ